MDFQDVKIVFVGSIVVFIIMLNLYFSSYAPPKECFSNYTLDGANGAFPAAVTDVLVQDIYPITGKNGITDNSASNIWREYPVFKVGSYDQTSNNIRYPSSPDEGTCMPASMCGALYNKKVTGSNTIEPLPPVNSTCGTRVGYFTTPTRNLVLPYHPVTANL
jgi:hypothetical protein